MPSERLRDTNEDWGLSIVDNAKLARIRQRDRDRKRAQRALMKLRAPPIVCELPVDNYHCKPKPFRLKAQDIQDLGIIAVPNKYTNISLPFVSILHGEMR